MSIFISSESPIIGNQICFRLFRNTVDQRVVTGQNPQSAHGVGETVLKELKKLK